MRFNHKVKHNGILYPVGADVPIGNKVQADVAETEVVKDEAKAAKTKVSNKKTKK